MNKVLFHIVVLVSTLAPQALCQTQVSSAIQASRQRGRPILAIVTSQTCMPCQALKHTLQTDPNVRRLLSKFEFLSMDSGGFGVQEFQRFFPADTRAVPMVMMVRPDGKILYSRPGNIPSDKLRQLLHDGLNQSGIALTDPQQHQIRQAVAAAKRKINENEFVEALALVDDFADLNTFATDGVAARQTRAFLHRNLRTRLSQIDALMQEQTSYGAAFRLAELYIGAKRIPDLRDSAAEVLSKYESDTENAEAVAQGKELVRARYHEKRDSCHAAIASYDKIVAINANSPTGQHATSMISILRKREAQKLARSSPKDAFPATYQVRSTVE